MAVNILVFLDQRFSSVTTQEQAAELKPLTDALRIFAAAQLKLGGIRRELLRPILKPEHKTVLASPGSRIDSMT